MGQARQRGTYSERKAMAIQRQDEAAEKRRINNIEREKNMSKDALKNRHIARLVMAQALAHTVVIK